MMEAGLEAGAEDIVAEDGVITVTTDPSDFESVLEALQAKGYESVSAEVSMVPDTYSSLDEENSIAPPLVLFKRPFLSMSSRSLLTVAGETYKILTSESTVIDFLAFKIDIISSCLNKSLILITSFDYLD